MTLRLTDYFCLKGLPPPPPPSALVELLSSCQRNKHLKVDDISLKSTQGRPRGVQGEGGEGVCVGGKGLRDCVANEFTYEA